VHRTTILALTTSVALAVLVAGCVGGAGLRGTPGSSIGGSGLGGGGDGGAACTLIGCVDALHVELPAELLTARTKVVACADGRCVTWLGPTWLDVDPSATGTLPQATVPLLTIPLDADVGRSVAVSVEVTEGGIPVEIVVPDRVPVRVTEPNGPGCGTCRDAHVAVALP
jgi:hypothetical protein